jgi:phage terminase large subunit-like protein
VVVRLPDGTVEHRKPVDLPAQFDLQLHSWGMAFKDTRTSDYVVGQVQAAKGGDRYLMTQTRDRMDFPGTLLAVRQMCGTWPAVSLKLVEDKANGPAVVQSLYHQIAGFVEVNPEGGKIFTRSCGQPTDRNGFINECAAFPAGVNDDQVDAWSQGAKRLMTVGG